MTFAPKVRKCSYCDEPLPSDAQPKTRVCDACVEVLLRPGAKVTDAINRKSPREPATRERPASERPPPRPRDPLSELARRVDNREASEVVRTNCVPTYVVQERAARLRMKHFGPAWERRQAEQRDADSYITGGKP